MKVCGSAMDVSPSSRNPLDPAATPLASSPGHASRSDAHATLAVAPRKHPAAVLLAIAGIAAIVAALVALIRFFVR